MTLALLGGKPVVEAIPIFNTIGPEEKVFASRAVNRYPLSGYLGGRDMGGHYIRELERRWRETFRVEHAIACNSATSGLLAACAAVGIKPGDGVITTPYTMSATAAAPKLLGADIKFADIEPITHCIDPTEVFKLLPGKAVIATNLFGHPAQLQVLKTMGHENGFAVIEDNAQAIYASEAGYYTGSIGDIGVFSLNVHKHLQCGEGGVITTNNDELAAKIRGFCNHGEMAGMDVGLNLRMTEVTAAIAIAQLTKAPQIMKDRVWQAEMLTEQIEDVEWLTEPAVRPGCNHSYYIWAMLYDQKALKIPRKTFVQAMEAEGFPLVEGYVEPLYHLPAFKESKQWCNVAETRHRKNLIYFENCGWTLGPNQIIQFGEAIKKIESNVEALRKAA